MCWMKYADFPLSALTWWKCARFLPVHLIPADSGQISFPCHEGALGVQFWPSLASTRLPFWCPDAVSSSPVCDSAVDRVASLLVFINHSNPEAHPWSAMPAWTKALCRNKKQNHKRPALCWMVPHTTPPCAAASPQTPALRKTANDLGIGSPKTRPHFIACSFSLENKSSMNGRLTWNKIITHSGQQAIRVKWSLRAGCNTVAVPAVSWKCSKFFSASISCLKLSLLLPSDPSFDSEFGPGVEWPHMPLQRSAPFSGIPVTGCWTLNDSCQVRLVPT